MNQKPHDACAPVAALTVFAVAVLLTPWPAVAQASSPKKPTTWQDLGFNQVPEGVSTDVIPLFEGLNEARGTWSFEGTMVGDDEAAPLKGSLHIMGNPKSGMVPMWQLAWGWPADDPKQSLMHTVMAGPSQAGFDLMLIRIGPLTAPGPGNAKPKVPRTPFQGTWDLESRTITWTERDLPAGLHDEAAKDDSPKPKQSFDMVVAADGKILLRNSKHMPQGQMVSAKAVVRTDEAPAEPASLTSEHSFKTAAEISDRRIKPCLPPQAIDISLRSERNGHFARYKVAEADFMTFLDKLWEASKDSSAHKRDEMHGEGEPASRAGMARRFKAAGWEPLDKAVVYYSPSKGNGAMTTYYYDREAGIAYHDTGYW